MPLYQTDFYPPLILEAWKTPTFQNGWGNYGYNLAPAGYCKDPFGIVHLRGTVVGNPATPVIFTLPTGYRPDYYLIFSVSTSDSVTGTVFGRLDINSNGEVLVMSAGNAYVGLDGITFRAT